MREYELSRDKLRTIPGPQTPGRIGRYHAIYSASVCPPCAGYGISYALNRVDEYILGIEPMFDTVLLILITSRGVTGLYSADGVPGGWVG